MSYSGKKFEMLRRNWRRVSVLVVGCLVAFALFVHVPPVELPNHSIVWLKNGMHYMDAKTVADRISAIDTPKQAILADEISKATANCDAVAAGYCQRSPGDYAVKTLVVPAVDYVPGTPDTKQITGYCTLCNDGSFSPSCAVGRGACSWHGGVAAYNVQRYIVIPGKAAIEAKPAVYNYEAKSYADSPQYVAPTAPSAEEIVNY